MSKKTELKSQDTDFTNIKRGLRRDYFDWPLGGKMRDPNQVETRRSNGTLDVATLNTDATMTQQQFKDECDINNIMKRYTKTGEWSHLAKKVGRYGDFSNIGDYQSMLDTVIKAEETFMELPAMLRYRFNNKPGELIEFLNNPENYDEGVKLGLITPKGQEQNAIKTNETQNDQKKREQPAQKKPKQPVNTELLTESEE